ncbi:MAG: hypothetical protein M3Z00_12290 [Actinomycetota bacterium]|nr:hypothetical protein [Actinomycetota bacterium]
MRHQLNTHADAQMRRRSAVGALARPTVLMLLAATIAHIMRRNIFDIVIFAGTAGMIVVDSAVHAVRARASARGTLAVPWWVVTAAAVVFGALVGSLTPAGWPVRTVLGLPGLAALILLLMAPPPAGPEVPGRDRGDRAQPAQSNQRRGLDRQIRLNGPGWLAWPALLIVAALIELSSFLLQPNAQTDSYDHPTLSTLISPLLGSPILRAVALACWFTAGWWLVRTIWAGGRR